jgi:carboxyl-terminal processing protease
MEMKRLTVLLAMCLVACTPEGSAARRDARGAPEAQAGARTAVSPDERERNLASFDLVWKTVKDTNPDSTIGGLDWAGMRDALRPRMESAATIDEARAVIQDLLEPLNQSHFMLIPGEYFEGERTDSALAGLGVCGFDVRLMDGAVLVTSVLPDSPAHAAGVRPGWEALRVDGAPVRETIDEIAAVYRGRSRFEFELVHTLYSDLSGEAGDRIPVAFRDDEGRVRELEIALVKRPGHYVPAYGTLGPAFVDFQAKRLDGNVGYIRFNGFAGVVYLSSAFNGAMDTLRTSRGVILDLRGNSGGIGGIALSMAGWFVAEKGKSLATIASRDRVDRIAVVPRARTYAGPLAVLVDGLSASAAEFLSGGLQDLGRARLFGSRTAGFSGRGGLLELPNGDVFMHVMARHLRADGTDVEGTGVAPDEEAPQSRASLLAGKDAALEAALRWLKGM